MKLRHKLLVAPLATAVVALGVAAVHAWTLHVDARGGQAALQAELARQKALGDVHAGLGVLQSGVYRTLAILDSLDEAQVKTFGQGVDRRLGEMATQLQAQLASGATDAEMQPLLQALVPLLADYRRQVAKALELTAIDANMAVAAMKAAEISYGKLNQGMEAIEARAEAASKALQAAADARTRWRALLFGALALLATGLAVAASGVMLRRLAQDLSRAVDASREVAAGRLTAQLHTDRRDEVGDLLRGLDTMVQQLRQTLLTVRDASGSLDTAAKEIAAGNSDLSQRTEHAASNLQQTAASLEQLTGTVRQSADAAAQASQLAQSAAGVAQRGGEMVARVVATMDEINSGSRRIGDIIGTIDGIAFQTNILALNAAVEAARAGEQGRGFAVVAGEVRSLAQRSAQAAREIKALIGASVERAEAGAKLVQDAGGTMDEIVASVRRVSDIVNEISAAAGEQSSGIGQVNGAVAQLDQVTQQNAALVEQSAAAAESLHQQASALGAVVNRFVLR